MIVRLPGRPMQAPWFEARMARKEGLKMPNDPRHDPAVVALANELATLEPVALRDRLRSVKDEDALGWVRYHFMDPKEMARPWQVIVINRWLERDKFFRNILPAWIGTVAGILSLVISILALVVSLKALK
jgi:hypothetical protein